MSQRHYPNKCFVCDETNKLQRCSACKMISYCGKEHQMQHRPVHKSFCKIISEILKTQEKSHIYENVDPTNWLGEKHQIILQVETKLKRSLSKEESLLINEPRVCFVCSEANQEKLKTCPKCLITSFCDIHPSSYIHERNCVSNEIRDETEKTDSIVKKLITLVSSVAAGTKIMKLDDAPPTSLTQFFELFTKQKIPEELKLYLSEFFSIPLTLYSALKTLFDNIPSKLVILLKSTHFEWTTTVMNYWEALLHLLPEVKILKVFYFDKETLSTKRWELTLCKDCKSKKKNLLVEMNPESHDEPTLIAVLSSFLSSDIDFYRKIGCLVTEGEKCLIQPTCPVVLTADNEMLHSMAIIEFINFSNSCRSIYSGYNEFSSLLRLWPSDLTYFHRHSQFISIFPDRNYFEQKFTNIDEISYYPQICHVCRKTEGKIICQRCRCIAYCDRKHQTQDYLHHKDVCEVISRLVKESGGKHLFSKAKNCDQDSWLHARIEAIKNTQMRIGRELTNFEKEMFLYPKTCGVCHESDSSLLKNCECGVFLCKKHKSDPAHKKICSQLAIDFKMTVNHAPINVDFSMLSFFADETASARNIDSMKGFINMTSTFLKQNPDKIFDGQLPVSVKMIDFPLAIETSVKKNSVLKTIFATEFLSSIMTLFYAMDKLNVEINSTMVIHVIGANVDSFEQSFLWTFLLFTHERIETLKIIFVDFIDYPESALDQFGMKTNLIIQGIGMDYEKYLSSEEFVEPDVIFGCDLNIHENKFRITEKIWKPTISAVEKVGVPFVITAGTKERAENDHETICQLLEKSVNFEFLEENPFASLCPQRDFETAGVMFANKFIIAYNWKLQVSSNSTVENEKMKRMEKNLENNFEQLNVRLKNLKIELEKEFVEKKNFYENLKLEISCGSEETRAEASEFIPETGKLGEIRENESEKISINCGDLKIQDIKFGKMYEEESQQSKEEISTSQDDLHDQKLNVEAEEIIEDNRKIESENPNSFKNLNDENSEKESQKISDNLESEAKLDSDENDSKSQETISEARETNEKNQDNGPEKNQAIGSEKNREIGSGKNQEIGSEKHQENEAEKINNISGNLKIEIEKKPLMEKIKENKKFETEGKQSEFEKNEKNQKIIQKPKKVISPQDIQGRKEILSEKIEKKSSHKKIKEKKQEKQEDDSKAEESKVNIHKYGENDSTNQKLKQSEFEKNDKKQKIIQKSKKVNSPPNIGKKEILSEKIEKKSSDKKIKKKQEYQEDDSKILESKENIHKNGKKDSKKNDIYGNSTIASKKESLVDKIDKNDLKSKRKLLASEENDLEAEEIVSQAKKVKKNRKNKSKEINALSVNLNAENKEKSKENGKHDKNESSKLEKNDLTPQENQKNNSIQYPETTVQDFRKISQEVKETNSPKVIQEPKEIIHKNRENGPEKIISEKLNIEPEQKSVTEKVNENEKSQTELLGPEEIVSEVNETILQENEIIIEKSPENEPENMKKCGNLKTESEDEALAEKNNENGNSKLMELLRFEENNLEAEEIISKTEQIHLETNENILETKNSGPSEIISKKEEIISETKDLGDGIILKEEEIISKTEEIINLETKKIAETENDGLEKIKVASEDSNRENKLETSSELLAERNSCLRVENEKLKEKLDLVNTENAKLKNQISVFQKIYPDFVNKNCLIKEALKCIEKSITSAFDCE